MNKRLILGSIVISLAALLLLSGCGGGEDTSSQAESASQATPETAAPETAVPEAEIVAAHDCAGGCGMKDWPEDQLTEIEGKWYCAGCAKKAEAASTEEGHGDG
jgi:hypothetical protein